MPKNNKLYDTASSFGKVYAYISGFVSVIIGLLFISGGIYFIIENPDVDLTNPDGFMTSQKLPAFTPWVFMGVGLLIITYAVFWIVATTRSKDVSAAYGTYGFINMITSPVRR
jgi:hypothetical protein